MKVIQYLECAVGKVVLTLPIHTPTLRFAEDPGRPVTAGGSGCDGWGPE